MATNSAHQPTKCRPLLEALLAIFRSGFKLSMETWQFADSTLGITASRQLGEVLNDADSDEGASLIELICFPDESVQIRLENLLEKTAYDLQDQDYIQKYLYHQAPSTKVFPPQGHAPVTFKLTKEVVAQFVNRLNICKRLDHQLIEAVGRYVAASNEKKPSTELTDPSADALLQATIKVKLRNLPHALSGNDIEFIAHFLEKMGCDQNLLELIDFLLDFLSGGYAGKNMYTALITKKELLLTHLQRADAFEKRLAQGNMETLMSQGVRAAYIDKQAARQQMRMIDRICRAVYGRTEYFQSDRVNVDVGLDAKNLPQVIKTFT